MALPKTPLRAAGSRRRRPIALAALRGFDLAARKLSFTDAAADLALTQSAISRQIATLERQIGKPLFVRRTRALALTPAGHKLQAVVARALAEIDRCVDEVRGVGRSPRVSLTTFASFASLWLVPRLAAFQRAQPQIEIRIDASDHAVDLEAEGFDVAIRRCLPRQVSALPGVTRLWVEVVTPALSPQLLERHGGALAGPADLMHLPLIEMDEQWPSARASNWGLWFEHAGLPPPAAASAAGLTFSYVDQAVQAAVRGQGVVIGRSPLLDEAIAAGQLVEPFPAQRMATGYRYHLVVQPGRADAPEVAAFAAWLVGEFERASAASR